MFKTCTPCKSCFLQQSMVCYHAENYQKRHIAPAKMAAWLLASLAETVLWLVPPKIFCFSVFDLISQTHRWAPLAFFCRSLLRCFNIIILSPPAPDEGHWIPGAHLPAPSHSCSIVRQGWKTRPCSKAAVRDCFRLHIWGGMQQNLVCEEGISEIICLSFRYSFDMGGTSLSQQTAGHKNTTVLFPCVSHHQSVILLWKSNKRCQSLGCPSCLLYMCKT